MRWYQFKVFASRKLADLWYWLMTPLAWYYSNKREKERYEKNLLKITEKQIISWIAEDIARYLIRNKNSSVELLICDDANENDFWEDCSLSGGLPFYIRRKKTRMGFYKFKRTVEFQEAVIEKLKNMKFIKVNENVEDLKPSWRIENYRKTCVIEYKKR